MKAVRKLYFDVTFDDSVTDADSIAVALDKLLEPVLSAPNILEEYGNPIFTEVLAEEGLEESLRRKILQYVRTRKDGNTPEFHDLTEVLDNQDDGYWVLGSTLVRYEEMQPFEEEDDV